MIAVPPAPPPTPCEPPAPPAPVTYTLIRRVLEAGTYVWSPVIRKVWKPIIADGAVASCVRTVYCLQLGGQGCEIGLKGRCERGQGRKIVLQMDHAGLDLLPQG